MSDRLSMLRKHNKMKRLSLSTAQQQKASFWICLRIARHPSFKKARVFAAYVATKGEASLAPLIKIGLNQKKVCLLPKITDGNLSFYPYRKKHILKRGCYGIKEPISSGQAYSLNDVDCIICPLLAFDTQGNRVGMGGGYYDKALAQIKNRSKKHIWGAAYSFQKTEKLTPERWDIPMHGIFTPNHHIQAMKTISAQARR